MVPIRCATNLNHVLICFPLNPFTNILFLFIHVNHIPYRDSKHEKGIKGVRCVKQRESKIYYTYLIIHFIDF